MIRSLYIENFALISSQRIFFSSGLNVITGESGSGKTIILEAVNFLMGDTPAKDIFFSGTGECYVEALFELSVQTREVLSQDSFFENLGHELILCRSLRKGGKSRYFLDNRQITRETLFRLRPFLLESCFRTDALKVYSSDYLLDVVDAMLIDRQTLQRVKQDFSEYYSEKKKYENIAEKRAELEQKRELVNMQLTEIDESGLLSWKEEDLESEYELLANYEHVTSSLREISDFIQQTSIGSVIGDRLSSLHRISSLPSQVKELVALLETVESSCSEYTNSASSYLDGLYYDRERLDVLEKLMEKLASFQKKYGNTIENIREYAEKLRVEAHELDGLLDEKKSSGKLKKLTEKYQSSAKKLSAERKKVCDKLVKGLSDNLSDLALGKSRIFLDWKKATDSARGYDRFELYFSANPGYEPQPVTKIASFGEQSRLLLALKASLLSPHTGSILFDEIEAGLGGRTLSKAVRKIHDLSKSHQVISVTHCRKLAEKSHKHICVEKETGKDSTTLKVRELNLKKSREKELSRLLS